MHALNDGDRVAVSVDSDTMPCKVLLIRGAMRITEVEGIAPEYEAMAYRIQSREAAQQWLATMRQITPRMTMLYVRPDWVGIIDFETRFPSALERRVEHAQSQAMGS